MQYITTVPFSSRTKKSWLALCGIAMKKWDFENYLYIKQKGNSKFFDWKTIDYQNLLRAVRTKNRRNFRPIENSKWWLDHRLQCYKRGIKIDLAIAINYK